VDQNTRHPRSSFSVSKKSFRPAWGRNTPSAQPVSVRFAPGNRGRNGSKKSFLPVALIIRTCKSSDNI
jgi:hypothetical protein